MNASLALLPQADELRVAMRKDRQTPRTPTDASPLQADLRRHGVKAQIHRPGPATPVPTNG